jgi:hypothetical protein
VLAQSNNQAAGRFCPADYRLSPTQFIAEAAFSASTLYAAGGIYGNLQALEAMAELLAHDPDPEALLVANGDAHWFDADTTSFLKIEEGLAPYHVLVGNVEAELRRKGDAGAGCGCAYPQSVDDGVVERSNSIHATLRATYHSLPQLHARFAARDSILMAEVGMTRVAVVHGDERLLAGWNCSFESLSEHARQHQLREWMAEAHVNVLMSSHTCAPAALALSDTQAVINNGAAGMPNFQVPGEGLVSRVSLSKHPAALYRATLGPKECRVYVEAVPLVYDQDAFVERFDTLWPEGSPAAASYRQRIVHGVESEPARVIIAGFALCQKSTD